MNLIRFGNLFILQILVLCSVTTGAPYSSQCPDNGLEITDGYFTLSKMYNHSSTLKYVCEEGYYPQYVNKRVCLYGKWSPEPTSKPVKCKRITCPNPRVIENGYVNPGKMAYYVNDTTTYECNSGYTFSGSATRVCKLNGKWSGSTPICRGNSGYCPDPGTPAGAKRQGSGFAIDDKVVYTCDRLLKLFGSKERVCMDGAYWSGMEPECYADFTYDTPGEVAEAFSSSLKTTLTMNEESGQQHGKKITLDQAGKLDIYIALDASDSIEEEDFAKAKNVIITLMDRISYYQVSPNYEVIIFTTNVNRIVSMADYKMRKENELVAIIDKLTQFKFDDRGNKLGTNLNAAYTTILESMNFEKARNEKNFLETNHVVIMFTDGAYNMGGSPKLSVNRIHELVLNGDENRKKYLDLYLFGMGNDVVRQDVDEWVTKGGENDKHLFFLRDIEDIQQALEEMIDESTSVGLCGLYKSGIKSEDDGEREKYPWLMKITITHEDGTIGNCLGSLVTPKFILTAAHCFRSSENGQISVDAITAKNRGLSIVKQYIPHPNYNISKKVSKGIKEYYEYDVALIELEESVTLSAELRPICIPCTEETSAALKLTGKATCKIHEEKLFNKDLVKVQFMSDKLQNTKIGTKKGQIKLDRKKPSCIEDVRKTLNLTKDLAQELVSDFLCTGGSDKGFLDAISCKGDSGGAVLVQQPYRLFQVGVVSWGLVDVCVDPINAKKARDFHTNLFNPEVQKFLAKYLGDEKIGAPLTFL